MTERFGNYELLEKVAAGGMAEVFRARSVHGQGVRKILCIKRIHPALSADAVFVAMFIEEARLGVTMVHGNIVPVFDFGCVDGRYYLAMEWVEGMDLAALAGRARVVGLSWPPELAAHIVSEVLEGLSYAHRKRDDRGRPLELVHRDVSPSNVLVSFDGQVKLLDFGIARSQAREFETRTGVIKGKPGYMSPEQATGGTVDARADIWSCGAVLYELALGARLCDGRKALPDPALDAIVQRATAPAASDRYPSAVAFQEALGAYLGQLGSRPNTTALSEFIDKVRKSEAPGENWDMRSTAVEKHLARAMEAAQRSTAVRLQDAETAPATMRLDSGSSPGTQVITERRFLAGKRPVLIGMALVIAGIVTLLTILTRTPSETTDAAPSLAPSTPSGDSDSHAPALPPPSPDAGASAAGTGGNAPPRNATPEEPSPKPHTRPSNRASAPASERRAFLSVNTSPWSNIVLDGKPIGQTPIRIDAPQEIAPGRHVLILTNPISGASRTLELTVRPGEHKIVSERL